MVEPKVLIEVKLFVVSFERSFKMFCTVRNMVQLFISLLRCVIISIYLLTDSASLLADATSMLDT